MLQFRAVVIQPFLSLVRHESHTYAATSIFGTADQLSASLIEYEPPPLNFINDLHVSVEAVYISNMKAFSFCRDAIPAWRPWVDPSQARGRPF